MDDITIGIVYTRHDVAKLFKFSIRKVDSLIATGKLEALKIGGRSVRITKDALQEFIKNSPKV